MQPHSLKCSRCGGSNLEPGSIQSFGKILFRPDNIKFVTLKAGLQVAVEVCLDCGNVQMMVEAQELARLTNRS